MVRGGHLINETLSNNSKKDNDSCNGAPIYDINYKVVAFTILLNGASNSILLHQSLGLDSL